MKLGEKRKLFTKLLACLIEEALCMGFEPQIDEVKRHPKMAEYYASRGLGIKNSLHVLGLAVDMDLFLDGKYLTDTADYEELGVWWEQAHPLCRWGGRFKRRDGRHFSIEHNGVK